MKVKALKDGFYISRRKAGDVFNVTPNNFRGWMQKIEEPKVVEKPKRAEPKMVPEKIDTLL